MTNSLDVNVSGAVKGGRKRNKTVEPTQEMKDKEGTEEVRMASPRAANENEK